MPRKVFGERKRKEIKKEGTKEKERKRKKRSL
jgi:hypothetical protein